MGALFFVEFLKKVQSFTKELSFANSQSTFPKPGWTWAFRNQALAFVENMVSGTPSIASGQDSLNDLLVVEHIWEKIL